MLFLFCSQLPYIRNALTKLASFSQLWSRQNVKDIWRNVVTSPLTANIPPLTEDQQLDCFHSLQLLYRSEKKFALQKVYFSFKLHY